MKLRVGIEIETKEYSFKELIEEFDFIEEMGITEKDFDSRKAEICEYMEKEIMKDENCPLKKIKISIARMGR